MDSRMYTPRESRGNDNPQDRGLKALCAHIVAVYLKQSPRRSLVEVCMLSLRLHEIKA